jgi:hypothetical protein
MATEVPQRTPWEPLLDANRTPEFAMRMPMSGCHSGFILSEDPVLHSLSFISVVFVCFDYIECS